jgi:hypothetical protein
VRADIKEKHPQLHDGGLIKPALKLKEKHPQLHDGGFIKPALQFCAYTLALLLFF